MYKQYEESIDLNFLKTMHNLFDNFLMELSFLLRENHEGENSVDKSSLIQDEVAREINALIVSTKNGVREYTDALFYKENPPKQEVRLFSEKVLREAHFIFINQLLIFQRLPFVTEEDRKGIAEIANNIFEANYLNFYEIYLDRAKELMQLFNPKTIN